MEASFHGDRFHNLSSMDLRAVGKRSPEWESNAWKWDGDLFIARQLNSGSSETIGRQFFPLGSGAPTVGNSSNSTSSCSNEGNIEIIERGRMEMDRKRNAEDENLRDDAGSLTLKLGGQGYHSSEREKLTWEGNRGKKTKVGGVASNRPICQVENCGADLSKVKDYHRRHKVCEKHSKASNSLVGGIMQRFCQQCSRFHVLQEFDEGKRSCRRRLAGHNKRRRKTNPDTGDNRNPLNDDQMSSYLLMNLLKILSNMHSNTADHVSNQDLLPHLLKSLAGLNGQDGGRSISSLLQGSQGSLDVGTSVLLANRESPQDALRNLVAPMLPQREAYVDGTRDVQVQDGSSRPMKMNDIDLNGIYIDSDDGTEDVERSPPMNPTTSSLDYPLRIGQDSYQSSPPQTSRNSDSASGQSPSSSSGDAQSRTDRIVFKLFGKEPNDFPVDLRAQILEWLAHSPTNMESYIRPGCIILTIYLCQAEAAWEELCNDLGFYLSRLLDLSDDTFWSTGWIYVRVQNQIAFACNGQVVIDASVPLRCSNHSQILSVKPIAVASTEKAQFTVRGINLHRPSTRLLCAIEGKYLIQPADREVKDGDDELNEQEQTHCVNFYGDIPFANGRGFIEIEDQGLSSSFFPFIVAEDNVCSEIRMLESSLEFTETDASKQAMDFIHELGWLLHKTQRNSNHDIDPFPLRRFKWLIEFSMDREWCAVISKLLNILFDGAVDSGEHSSLDLAVSDMCLLHRAVRKNSKTVVEMLLRYVPEPKTSSRNNFLFTPDVTGPAGLTPLHIAAGKDGSEDVLEALIEDPGRVGVEAWKNAHDSTGFAPEDYARLRGHYSYIHLVQRKSKKPETEDHVVINIPTAQLDPLNDHNRKQNPSTTTTITPFEINQTRQTSVSTLDCKLCDLKKAHGGYRTGITTRRSMAYRPAMLSMVAVAAVCVCVALLFKSCPEVLYVFQPFRWEYLDYGTG